MSNEREAHTFRVRGKRAIPYAATVSDSASGMAGAAQGDGSIRTVLSAKARAARLSDEIERQRSIYRPGTSEALLRRAAVRALMDRGDY